MRDTIIRIMLVLAPVSCCYGQNLLPGQLTGGFETNTVYYLPDSVSKSVTPEDRFASNNYFKLDYRLGKFSGGLMYEAYLPVLQGLPLELKGNGITFKYASFTDERFDITVGDFYEQFGSGLVLRAYEERLLGLNNSMEGVKLAYRINQLLVLKAVYGRPRRYMDRVDNPVRGVDVSFGLGRILNLKDHDFTVEGSYVNKYEKYTGTSALVNPNVHMLSLRSSWEHKGFALKGEYVYKSKDPALYNDNLLKNGNALLLEGGYTTAGTGISFSLRRLEYMDVRSSRTAIGLGEVINYLPALTRQHTYALAGLNPYAAQANGETGGQLDFSHFFPEGSFLGSSQGTLVNVNISTYYNLKGSALTGYDFWSIGDELLYRDINMDIVKQWNARLTTTFVYSRQVFNPSTIGKTSENYRSHTGVVDALYKIDQQQSVRLEASHLWSGQDKKNWTALNISYDLAPRWSFYVGDMYNYGDTKIHYYHAGASYAASRTRVALNYGRNREGYQCVGGVCRLMPAYTGLNLSLTSSF